MNYPIFLKLEEMDAAYLASIIDGEGNIGINRAKSVKGLDYFQPKISISNSDLRLAEWITRVLSDLRLYLAKARSPGRKIVYHTQIIGNAPVNALLNAVIPFLLLKRTELVFEYTGSRVGKPKFQPYSKRQKDLRSFERNAPKGFLILR